MPDALTDALRRVQSGLGVSSEILPNELEESAAGDTVIGPAPDPVPVVTAKEPAKPANPDQAVGRNGTQQPLSAEGLSHDYSRGLPQTSIGYRSRSSRRAPAPAQTRVQNLAEDDDVGANGVMAPLARVDQLLNKLRHDDDKVGSGASDTSSEAAKASAKPQSREFTELGARDRESVRLAASGQAQSADTSLGMRKLMRELPADWSAKIVACADAPSEDEAQAAALGDGSMDADERTVANSPPRVRRESRKVLFMWDRAGSVFVYDESDDSINGVEIEKRYADWEVTPSDFQRYVKGSRRFPDKGLKPWNLFRRK